VSAGTDWALGVEARSRALLSEGEIADRLYREAIERLGRTRMRAEVARVHLLSGKWLRRENRRINAREQLRASYQTLTAIGMEGFAERARRELLATGGNGAQAHGRHPHRPHGPGAQIAKLARDGHGPIRRAFFKTPPTPAAPAGRWRQAHTADSIPSATASEHARRA
jgi:hypothetical protein